MDMTLKNQFSELTREKMAAVVQIYVAGYAGEEVKSILNPRIGELKEWSGSGFFIRTEYGQGVIVTNAHVVKNAKSIEIMSMLTSEETFQAELVGMAKNQEPDVAIIKLKKGQLKKFKSIAKKEIPYLELQPGARMSRGTELKAIGYPMGMTEPNITGGEITNFISGNREASERYVTDAAINPGNSGGPAINDKGEVVGINTSIYQEAENIGFITPCSFVEIILKNIFNNNAICFSDIGGEFQSNSQDVSVALGMSENAGLIVSSLDKGGFLDCAGIQPEDVIMSLNGHRIDRHGIVISDEYFHRRNIFDVLKLVPIGEAVQVGFWRAGKEHTAKAKAMPYKDKKMESKPIISEREFVDLWGMTIQILTYEILEAFNLVDRWVFYQLLKMYDENQERLIVTHIEKESAAYKQEWVVGEVISELNGKAVNGFSDLLKILDDGSSAYKLKSEQGAVGYFSSKPLSKGVKVLNPSMFLK